MIGTLFAQEYRSTRKSLFTAIGIVVLIAALSLTVAAVRIPVIGGLGLGLAVFVIAMVVPLVFGLLVENYWRTMYGREGYFTMSLPVHGRTIFTAKVLYGLLVTLIAGILTVIGVVAALIVFAVSQGTPFALAYEGVWNTLGEVDPVVAWVLMLCIALQLVFSVVAGAAIISIGSEARFNHLGFGAPVLGGVFLYIGMQIVGLAAMLFIPFGLKITGPDAGTLVARGMWQELVAELTSTGDPGMSGGSEPTVIGLGIVFVSVVVTVMLAWWGARSVEYRTSLR